MRTAKHLKVGDVLPNVTTGFGEFKNRFVKKITTDENGFLWILTEYDYFSYDGRHKRGARFLTNKAVNPSFVFSDLK